MRPLITYYGGKQQIAAKIVHLLPPHDHYIEPYAGGAAVLFAKGTYGRSPSSYNETINDINENIISMYRCFQSKKHRKLLLDRIEYTPMSRSEFERARRITRAHPDAYNLDEKAWATLVLFLQSFSSVGRSFGAGYQQRSRMQLRWRNRVRLIMEELRDRLDYLQIECMDALTLIQKYDRPGVTFYVDPPYPGTDQGEYAGDLFTQASLRDLVALLDQCQGSVVLSCYENIDAPKGWAKHTFDTYARCITPRMGGNKSHRTECVWVVDRSHTTQPHLVPLGQLALFGGEKE